MATFLHTMVRITDPARSRGFYEALGFNFSRDMDIVRNGETEATNYFFSIGDAENVLELTFNHDGRTYDIGTGYGHIAISVDDLDGAALGSEGRTRDQARARAVPGARRGPRICFVATRTTPDQSSSSARPNSPKQAPSGDPDGLATSRGEPGSSGLRSSRSQHECVPHA